MKQASFLIVWLISTLMASGCSVEITPTAQASPQPGLELTSSPAAVLPATQIPMTWGQLNLSGKLVYLSSATEGDAPVSKIMMLDLRTGGLSTLLAVSSGWVYYATVSADARSLVISYAPPPPPNTPSARSLYVLPLDGAGEPEPLFNPPTTADRYTQAEWSPDGAYVYYVHYNQEELAASGYFEDYQIVRMPYPRGEHQQILEHAFWPRLSADSSRLVYVSLDPVEGTNELFVANADGTNAQRVTLSGPQALDIIDAPIFSPDGRSILFSAPEPAQAYRPGFFERLLGIWVARAHSVPSDWWSVPVTGGTPTRLTRLQTVNLFASISPDGRHIASVSGDGLFVMEPDGANLTQLVQDAGVHGTVSWIP